MAFSEAAAAPKNEAFERRFRKLMDTFCTAMKFNNRLRRRHDGGIPPDARISNSENPVAGISVGRFGRRRDVDVGSAAVGATAGDREALTEDAVNGESVGKFGRHVSGYGERERVWSQAVAWCRS